MKKLIETLKTFGIEVPTEKEAEIRKALSEHYKNVQEVDKTLGKIEADRDTWKERAETAEETLKKFDGIDPEEIQNEIAIWKKKADDAEKDLADKLAQRDFEDALKESIAEAKGKNDKAIRALLDTDTLLKSKNQKEDIKKAIDALREAEDSSFLFVDEEQQKLEAGKAKFTGSLNQASGKKITPAELMKMKNENPDLDIRQYME